MAPSGAKYCKKGGFVASTGEDRSTDTFWDFLDKTTDGKLIGPEGTLHWAALAADSLTALKSYESGEAALAADLITA